MESTSLPRHSSNVVSPRTDEITLQLTPESRFDAIDVTKEIRRRCEDFFRRYTKAIYCSYHTTAGYFEQSLSAQLNHSKDSVLDFVESYQELFPPNANYSHDQLHLRSELTEEEKSTEPRNADSHLTFIGSGLENCVTYVNRPDIPVFFVDLDGVNGRNIRERQTTVMGYNSEKLVDRVQLPVSMSAHPIESVNLADPEQGLFPALNGYLEKYDIRRGRIDIQLEAEEQNAALTVNEYETLLMKHDVPEVLRNPVRFMAEKGRRMIQNPRAIPSRAVDYAKYDLVRIINGVIDKMGLSDSVLERLVEKFMALPASHFLRMKRSVSLLVNDESETGTGSVVQGTYQSPILIQWKKSQSRQRKLDVSFTRFE